MIADDSTDLGPCEATFETDLRRIRRGKIIVVLVSLLFAGWFAALAIFGVQESGKRDDWNKDPFLRIMSGVFTAARVVLGVHLFRKVSREAGS